MNADDRRSLDARVARVEEWIEGHEKRCEDRFQAIHDSVADIKDVLKSWRLAMWAAAVALIGWGGGQIYSDLKPAAGPDVAGLEQALR